MTSTVCAEGALRTARLRTGLAALLGAGLGILPLWAAAQPPASAPERPAAGASALAVLEVSRYDIVGNTLLDPQRIQAALAPYLGKVPLSRLREAASVVQDLYRSAGWGGVVAFVPEQALDDGVVRIRVLEGKLTDVGISGQRQFSESGVRAALPSLRVQATPHLRRLDAEIQLANENPARQLQVLLQPGQQPGEVRAQVSVDEQPVTRWSARLEDTGSRNTGQWRAALGWRHANVLGRDHVAGLEFQTSVSDPSAVGVFSGSYRVPLYGYATTLDAYAAWSKADAAGILTPAGELSFSGEGVIVGLRANHYLPRAGNLDQRLVVGLEWREYGNQCRVSGLAEAGCGPGAGDISLQPASLTYLAQWVDRVRVQGQVSLHANLAAGGRAGSAEDFDFARGGAKKQYALLRTGGSLLLPVGPLLSIEALDDLRLGLRAAVQLSGQKLVSAEQFGIGGAHSVRGYEEREFSADEGLQLSVELTGPDWGSMLGPIGASAIELRLVAFADAATVRNRGGDTCFGGQTRCPLAGAGLGLRASGADWSLRFDASQALRNGAFTPKGDARVHVQLAVQL